ncbi:probable protein phosphatase 2C 67 isoform X3 [Ananas comosus]|uniref:protein-serine/threonine phosphatase n=1 Tax=Ananas comosus TaxID=4615 RepID=A0A6P5FFJ4_ANACO|nr:probable protein phosphatase 2C 67 isoform X3 [Ananas comosus]
MSYHKRDADVLDENSVTKRSKGSDTAVQDVEKERENRDIGIFAKSSTLSVEGNGRNGSVSQPECKDKDNRIPECRGSSEETIACDSKVSNEKDGKSTSIEADAAEDKGCRHTMEDAWVVLPDASSEYPGKLRCAHFAIYDGHGGRLAADFAQRHLHANVLAAGLPRELMDIKAAKKAILEGFRRTDESLLEESAKGNWQDGATAVCVWVLGQTVMVANIGDAKAVLARSSSADQRLKAIVLTREHKAIYTQERTRIQKAGGSVGSNGRLQGRLEVSRAFGDRQFKKVPSAYLSIIYSIFLLFFSFQMEC